MLINVIESAIAIAARGVRSLRSRSKPAAVPPASPEEPKHDGDILVGHEIRESDAPGKPVWIEPSTLDRHVYLLGSTGCGKSTLVLRVIDALLGRRTCVVIDLRGDFVDRILLRLAAIGGPEQWAHRLLIVDPAADQVIGFNPLSGSGDLYSRVFLILDVLRKQSDWGVRIDEVMRNSLIALAETGWSLLEIEPLLNNSAFRARVLSGVTDGAVLAFFDTYERLTDENKLSWALPCLNKVTPLLATPALRDMFGQRQAFQISDWIDAEPGRVVLVSLAVDRFHHASHLIGGLFVSALQAAMMGRANQPEASRIPCTLFIDEFENFASDRFHEIIAEGRRFGLGLCLSHQNLTQLAPSLREALLNNVRSQFYFMTGASDAGDLSEQIVSDLSARDMKMALMAQRVGEATFLRRGQRTLRVRVENSPDPQVEQAAVAAIRHAALSLHGRPRTAVSQELLDRASQFRAMKETRDKPKPNVAPPAATHPVTPSEPDKGETTFEIRETRKDAKRSPRKKS